MPNIQVVALENDDVDIQIAILYKDPVLAIKEHFIDIQVLDRFFALVIKNMNIDIFVEN